MTSVQREGKFSLLTPLTLPVFYDELFLVILVRAVIFHNLLEFLLLGSYVIS